MKTTRRGFVQTSALAGVGLALAGSKAVGAGLNPFKHLRKFVADLPGVGPSGIPVATPNRFIYPGTDYYIIVAGQYRQQLHPDLPPSRLWGYADGTLVRPSYRYLGPAVVAKKGVPVRVAYVNQLPNIHPCPVDTTLPGAEPGQPVNRTTIHLHGGFVPWASDGGPYTWVAPFNVHGPSRIRWLPDRFGRLTDDMWYPNAQSSRLMWYHDHAMGITRINAYAGLAAPYVLVDPDEVRMFGPAGLVSRDNLPGVPLVLQDKTFKAVFDAWGRPGDLDYPSVYGPPDGPGTPPPISCVPEFFSDTCVVNGMAFPQLTLPAGVHRFRILNGSQSRMWNLQLYHEQGVTKDPSTTKGPDFIQIGTECGFMPQPVVVSSGNPIDVTKYFAHDQSGYGLLLGGAERADVLIDFSASGGASFILCNDAPAPFPMGDPLAPFGNDFYTGNGAPDSRHGPNTRTIMRIKIMPSAYTGPAGATLLGVLATQLASVNQGLIIPDALIGNVFEPPSGVPVRIRTLNEGVDEFGRLIQVLGTGEMPAMGGVGGTLYGTAYMDPLLPEEQPVAGATEVWDVYNTTGDVHPIHFHLVNVQIMGRAPFNQDYYGNPVDGVFTRSGDWVAPDPNERGYKETVRMNPGEITRVIMKFDLPPDPVVRVRNVNRTVAVPPSPRTGGNEYVWHCHILEHEEHDMMRPFVVL